MTLPPYRIALAVGEPHEARLLPAARGLDLRHRWAQPVRSPCSARRSARCAPRSRTLDSIDAVILSSTLQAVPPAVLEELVAIGRPIVLLVPDANAARWADLTVPIVGLDADVSALSTALAEAMQSRSVARPRSRARSAAQERTARGAVAADRAFEISSTSVRTEGEVITVTSAESSEGGRPPWRCRSPTRCRFAGADGAAGCEFARRRRRVSPAAGPRARSAPTGPAHARGAGLEGGVR